MDVDFTVYGRPEPAGSKRGFPFKRPSGQLGVRIVDANPKAAAWKEWVRAAAKGFMEGRPPLAGPLVLQLEFTLARGKTVTRDVPTVRPDTTKLVRAVEDALTNVVWEDDAQVVSQYAEKRYGEVEGVRIVVRQA